MEPKVKKNYSFSPWNMSRKEKDSFVLVTPENRQHAIVYGRILYVISGLLYRGCITVDPCFEKGWIHYPFKPWMSKTMTHCRVYISENMDYNQYVTTNKALIDKYIEEKSLYLKPTDPILTYKKE